MDQKKRTWVFPTKHPVINEDHLAGQQGDRSPKRLHIVRNLIAVMIGDYFQEGLKILDYGCGPGWLANFLSGELKKFTYWGIEPDIGTYQTAIILEANRCLGHDERVTFGQNEALISLAIENADVVYLGSIFTHLSWQHFDQIMTRLAPVIERDGLIVFDCFLGNTEELNHPGSYSLSDCYHTSFYIEHRLEQYFKLKGWKLEKVMAIMAHQGHWHTNFRATKTGGS